MKLFINGLSKYTSVSEYDLTLILVSFDFFIISNIKKRRLVTKVYFPRNKHKFRSIISVIPTNKL